MPLVGSINTAKKHEEARQLFQKNEAPHEGGLQREWEMLGNQGPQLFKKTPPQREASIRSIHRDLGPIRARQPPR